MSARKAPQKGPNLFSLFAKVAEKQQRGGDVGDADCPALKKQPALPPIVDLTTASDAKSPRAPLKDVDNVPGAATAAAHTKSGRIVVPDERRVSGGGGGGEGGGVLGEQQSPQASVGDAFMTPAHPLRAQQQDNPGDIDVFQTTPMMRGDDTPSGATTTMTAATVSLKIVIPSLIQGTPHLLVHYFYF